MIPHSHFSDKRIFQKEHLSSSCYIIGDLLKTERETRNYIYQLGKIISHQFKSTVLVGC